MSTSDQHDRARETDQDEMQRRFALWLDTSPRLTRLVFLLHRVDELPYDQVAWRCGIGRRGDATDRECHSCPALLS
jgi:DNA-directed RNA polymerase specialized sigma24 family protein